MRTFNLSQFSSSADLGKAFHEIRDVSLRGDVPLVFWDEFDSAHENRRLGWLKYFLAPTEDGQFTDKDGIHPLGAGIYIFAGGTYPTFEAFAEAEGETEAQADLKKSDFKGRLSACLNVKGVNPPKHFGSLTLEEKERARGDPAWRLWIIRRAVLLYSLLKREGKHLRDKNNHFAIDRGVLNALLLADWYENDSRSMNKIVTLSNLARSSRYTVSSLPSDYQLRMHVDAEFFRELTTLGKEFSDCNKREIGQRHPAFLEIR